MTNWSYWKQSATGGRADDCSTQTSPTTHSRPLVGRTQGLGIYVVSKSVPLSCWSDFEKGLADT
jgi:hypothetical protein